MRLKKINLISGERGTGKTQFCERLIKTLIENNLDIQGLISPGIYRNGKRICITVKDISSSKSKRLAVWSPGWDPEYPEREWKMQGEAIIWGNNIISHFSSCDVIIFDEIGYLELEKGTGWSEVFKVLKKGNYTCAFIVVRPSLLKLALAQWPQSNIIRVKNGDDMEKPLQDIVGYLIRDDAK